jgi:ABC-2 type transport system permease protein
MTAITLEPALGPVRERHAPVHPVPMSRLTAVELRKMFDTRSGAWLMASIVITGLLSTVATMFLAPDADLTYYTFAKAIGFPMTVLLPIIAVLAITGEWSQRSGLTTFVLVPHRSQVVLAKVIASVTVGVAAMAFALVAGVVGNVVGTAVAGTERVWDVSVVHGVNIVLGSLLCLLTGTVLGILFRSSAVALVAYFVYALLLPTVSSLLAASSDWYRDARPWVDLNLAQSRLFEGALTGEQVAQLAVTVTTWLVLPAVVGLATIARAEVR